MTNRAQIWKHAEEQTFDLLIVGCGITGAGAARDAALRGLKVAVVDAEDVAYGTSSRSSKLVHGGLRYLEHFEFSLVFEAVSERRILQNIAPHLVNPLGFIFPIYKGGPIRLETLKAGLWVYDGLSLFRSPKLHRALSKKQVAIEEPALRSELLKGAPLYYDCATDDARLTLETIIDAWDHGATVLTHARVTGFQRDDQGRLCGVELLDQLPGAPQGSVSIKANAIINATGPWTDRTRGLSNPDSPRLLSPTKGVHIVVDGARLPLKHAVVCSHPDDHRVLFAIPWGEQTYIGTTDTFFEGDPAEVCAESSDIDYLLEAACFYFPEIKLNREDVFATWAGLRPLISQEGRNEGAVSREHEIHMSQDGLITIAGGKLTTYRRMGAEVVSRALELLALLGRIPENVRDAHTGREPLPGAVGWPADDNHDAVAAQVIEASDGRLDHYSARHLGDRYGMRGLDIARLAVSDQRLLTPLVKGRPEILALVDWAVQRELALTVNDVMIRRTQLYFRDKDQGLGALELVADRMAELLDWDEERRTLEVIAYEEEVERSRRWRTV